MSAARDAFGLDVSVLRLLEADGDPDEMGGSVSYLAEPIGDVPDALVFERADQAVAADEPLRARWARPGGVEAILRWADAALAAAGRPRSGPAVQVKTWNLSSVLRIPTEGGDVWCKSVPPFLAHEARAIALAGALDPSLVPPLVGADQEGTALLGDVAGKDQWGASEPALIEMARRLVGLQSALAGTASELLAAGLPDWRPTALSALFATLAGRPSVREVLSLREAASFDSLLADLPRRLGELQACGLPDTLFHGDFHPGNWRSDGTSPVLLDWGDSGVGSPLLDLSAFLEAIEAEDVRLRVRDAWLAAWLTRWPLSDPSRAAELIAPVAALRRAVIYQGFLDGIEPDERRYHRTDVPDWIREALSLASSASAS